MKNCIYCTSQMPENFNFCPECEKQVICLHCKEQLMANKTKCFVCGNSLMKDTNGSETVNVYTLEEKQSKSSYSRKIDLRLSDSSIGEIAPVIGHLTNPDSSKTFQRFTEQQNRLLNDRQLPSGKKEALHTEFEKSKEKESGNDPIEDATIAEGPNKVFDVHDGLLHLTTTDLKGKTKKDQQVRFVLLFGWAFPKLMNDTHPDEESFKNAANRAGLLDNNFYARYLPATLKQYFFKTENIYKPKSTLEKEVKNILSEIDNDAIIGNEYWKPTAKRTRSGLNKDDKSEIGKWKSMTSSFNSFEMRSLDYAYEFAIISIFDITKELEACDSVKPVVAFEYLNQRYSGVKVKKRSFTNSFTSDSGAKYFNKDSEGKYFLTEDAERIAIKFRDDRRKNDIVNSATTI